MKRMTRRSFLKNALAGAAGLTAAGMLGPGAAMVQEKTRYTPGVYSASAKGGASAASVTMAFSSDAILDVEIDVSGPDPDGLKTLAEKIKKQLLKSQTADTDALASLPAAAVPIKTAAARCIADARGVELVTVSTETASLREPFSSWMAKPEEAARFAAEYTADVCVCGHGYAGIAACRELAESGKSVILIEKEREETYSAAGSEFAAMNARVLLQRGVPRIDPVEFYQAFMTNAGASVNQELIMKFAQNSEANINWYLSGLTDEELASVTTGFFPEAEGQLRRLGQLKFWPSACSFTGKDGLTGIQAYNRRAAMEHGARILFGTCADYLLMKGNEVAGVVAKTEKGSVKIHCRAAILATGGFGANAEMLRYFFRDCSPLFPEGRDPSLSAAADRDGRGIRMAFWAGGLLETRTIAGLYLKPGGPSEIEPMPQALWLDMRGRRFCDEYHTALGSRSLSALPPIRDAFYMVFDSNFPEYRCHLVPQTGAWSPLQGRLEAFRAELASVYASRQQTANSPLSGLCPAGSNVICAAGDTLEALAHALGLAGETRSSFIDSIARYNRICEAGRDDDFGRDAQVLFPVNEPPFYAIKTSLPDASAFVAVTLGGLVTDGNQNVLDTGMQPIQGLYASGNTCGRRFGNAGFSPIPGLPMGMAIVLGRECGKSAAQFLDK